MRYQATKLASNARVLRIATSVVVVVYTLIGVGSAIWAAAWASSQGSSLVGITLAACGAFGVCLVMGILIVAPLRLAIEVALCASKVEENTALLAAEMAEMRRHVTAREALPAGGPPPPPRENR
jgi:hypothetical protein